MNGRRAPATARCRLVSEGLGGKTPGFSFRGLTIAMHGFVGAARASASRVEEGRKDRDSAAGEGVEAQGARSCGEELPVREGGETFQSHDS